MIVHGTVAPANSSSPAACGVWGAAIGRARTQGALFVVCYASAPEPQPRSGIAASPTSGGARADA